MWHYVIELSEDREHWQLGKEELRHDSSRTGYGWPGINEFISFPYSEWAKWTEQERWANIEEKVHNYR